MKTTTSLPTVYRNALALLGARKNATQKKIANNTVARKTEDGSIAICLHNTDIITFRPDGRVTVNTSGFRTKTTKARINSFLPSPFPRLYQAKGVWHWTGAGVYADGDTFGPRGALLTKAGKNDEAKRIADLTKRINKYAALCAKSLPLPMPSGGDDWFSAFRTEDGKTLGEATNNTSHLESNMEENYVVPSLVLRALEATNAGDLVKAATFGKCPGFVETARHYVKTSVRRYMKARFGLAGGAFNGKPSTGW